MDAVGRVVEQLRRERAHGRQRAGWSHHRRAVVGQVQIAQVQVAGQTKIGHGQRIGRQITAQAAHGQGVTAQLADGHVVTQLARFVHRRHDGQYFGHFGLQFGYFTIATSKQT